MPKILFRLSRLPFKLGAQSQRSIFFILFEVALAAAFAWPSLVGAQNSVAQNMSNFVNMANELKELENKLSADMQKSEDKLALIQGKVNFFGSIPDFKMLANASYPTDAELVSIENYGDCLARFRDGLKSIVNKYALPDRSSPYTILIKELDDTQSALILLHQRKITYGDYAGRTKKIEETSAAETNAMILKIAQETKKSKADVWQPPFP